MIIKLFKNDREEDPVERRLEAFASKETGAQSKRRKVSYIWGSVLLGLLIMIAAALIDIRSILSKSQMPKQQPTLTTAISVQQMPPKQQVLPEWEETSVITQEIVITREIYTGKCMCPDDLDSSGKRCGKKSAYYKNGNGGYACY